MTKGCFGWSCGCPFCSLACSPRTWQVAPAGFPRKPGDHTCSPCLSQWSTCLCWLLPLMMLQTVPAPSACCGPWPEQPLGTAYTPCLGWRALETGHAPAPSGANIQPSPSRSHSRGVSHAGFHCPTSPLQHTPHPTSSSEIPRSHCALLSPTSMLIKKAGSGDRWPELLAV